MNHIEVEGIVTESTRGSYKVCLDVGEDNERIIKAHLGGKLKRNKIHIVKGDKVKVKLSVYDLTRGIIDYRL